jgi:hypothetical protein
MFAIPFWRASRCSSHIFCGQALLAPCLLSHLPQRSEGEAKAWATKSASRQRGAEVALIRKLGAAAAGHPLPEGEATEMMRVWQTAPGCALRALASSFYRGPLVAWLGAAANPAALRRACGALSADRAWAAALVLAPAVVAAVAALPAGRPRELLEALLAGAALLGPVRRSLAPVATVGRANDGGWSAGCKLHDGRLVFLPKAELPRGSGSNFAVLLFDPATGLTLEVQTEAPFELNGDGPSEPTGELFSGQ